MEKRIKAYVGVVSPQTLAFDFPSVNKQNVLDCLTREGRINQYIFVDDEEEAKMKEQQAAILARMSKHQQQQDEFYKNQAVTVEKNPPPVLKKKSPKPNTDAISR